MAMLTAAEVDQQLERLQAGAVSPEALGDWARSMRAGREPESEAVGEVLSRMQQLGRSDHLPQDVQVMREALRSRDAVARLHLHFSDRTDATHNPVFEADVRAKGRRRMDKLPGQRRGQQIAFFVVLVPWLLGSLVLGRHLDDPNDLGGWDLVMVFGYSMLLPVAAHVLYRFLWKEKAPRCPLCGTTWQVGGDGPQVDLIENRRCPNCRAKF